MPPLLQVPTNTRHLQVKVGALNHNLHRPKGNNNNNNDLKENKREGGVYI